MKTKAILNTVTAILLVGTFYVFTFCFIRNVDDVQISEDLRYSSGSESSDSDLSFDGLAESDSGDMPQSEIIIITEPPITEEITQSVDIHSEFQDEEKDIDDIENDEALYDDNNGFETVKATNAGLLAEKKDNDYSAMKKETTVKETTVVETTVTETEPVTKKVTTAPIIFTESVPVTFTETTVVTTIPVYVTSVPDIVISADDYSNNFSNNTPVTNPVQGNGWNESLSVKINGSVQTMDAYTLVCMIVANEVSSSFSDEAIKAQAVAAYSYVKYNNLVGLYPYVLASNNVSEKIKRNVSAVSGVGCYYNGSIAQTVYCSSTAGYSSSASNVWGTNVPYLVSVPCNVDLSGDPNYGVTRTFSESEIRSYLESNLGIQLSSDPSNWIKITSYLDTSYVGTVSIDGQKTISGRYLRENVMGFRLKSASFDVTYSNGQFVFTTYGYGHGVGMSQNGANILANQGYTYTDILKYYYTGITVQ